MRNAQTFLRMKTRPLRRGDVLFAYGNAAARTFGRAHRRRPYHFSCGSMSQGHRKRLCRRTKTREVAGQRGLMEIGRGGACVPAPTISRVAPCPKVAGEGLRRRTKTREVAGQRGLMEVGRGGACVPARVALQGRIHR